MKAHEKREEKRMQEFDIISWLIGRYCYEATSVAISNNFGKKKAEYAKMPDTLRKTEESGDRYVNMTEEEKLIEVQHIFSKLTAVESRIQMGGE